ncbi:MAG TPA: CRISPR system precrRNA processing endoribonuclease RAMP protein Cas6 [Myxococcota bacterium]|nr:CRISPR system precrRNA processing endoribonuclease RAMP protein Cas6 [Myxococcota bacterium]
MPDPSDWMRALPVTRLIATWAPERPWTPPPAVPNTLRGAVGASVMDVACVRDSRECHGCPHAPSCPILGWYDPNRAGGNRLRPYVIRVLQGAERATPDRPLIAEWILFGPTPHAHLLVEALLRAGRVGLGPDRVQHDLIRLDVQGEGALTRVVDDGRAVGAMPRPGTLLQHTRPPDAPTRATLDLLTPVQPPDRRLTPAGMLQLGAHRVRDVLRDLGGPPARWWDLDVVVARWEWQEPARHSRWSERQEATIDLSGLWGRLVVTDGVAGIADLLAAMEVLHVGRNTSAGMGRVGVTWG